MNYASKKKKLALKATKTSKQSLMCRQIKYRTNYQTEANLWNRFGYGTLLEDGRRYGPNKTQDSFGKCLSAWKLPNER